MQNIAAVAKHSMPSPLPDRFVVGDYTPDRFQLCVELLRKGSPQDTNTLRLVVNSATGEFNIELADDAVVADLLQH